MNLFLRHIGPSGESIRCAIGAFGEDVVLYPLADWERIGRRGRECGPWIIVVADWMYGAHLSGRFDDMKRRFLDCVSGLPATDQRTIPFATFKAGMSGDGREALAWLDRMRAIPEPAAVEEPDGAVARDEYVEEF